MTIERRALDALLAMFPDFDVLGIDWQAPYWDEALTPLTDHPGPWLIVTLGQRSDDGAEAWARHQFAIWKRTGATHGTDEHGAVIDPPIIMLS